MMRYLDHLKMESSSMQLAQQVVFGSVVLVSANLLVTQGVAGFAKQVQQYNSTPTQQQSRILILPVLYLLEHRIQLTPSTTTAATSATGSTDRTPLSHTTLTLGSRRSGSCA
jgi:hypothetical protein